MGLQANILLTRHHQAGQRTAGNLEEKGIGSTLLPLSKIALLNNPYPAGRYDGVIFTSPVAPPTIDEFYSVEKSSDIRPDLYSLAIYCVGEITAQSAKDAGFLNIVEVAKDAIGLAGILEKRMSGTKILYPCANKRSFDFATHLGNKDIECVNWEIYCNQRVLPDGRALAEAIKATDCVFLFSKRTADYFFEVVNQVLATENGVSCLARHSFVAISAQVAGCVPSILQSNTYIAKENNESAMIECIETIRR